jgi:hypothetical protein
MIRSRLYWTLACATMLLALPFRGAPGRATTEIWQDTLRPGRVFGDSLSFARVTSMQVVGTNLYVTDRQMDPHVLVFHYPSRRLVGRLGRHGSGPGEFQDPIVSGVDVINTQRVWLYDFQLRKLSLVDPERPPRNAIVEERPLNLGVSLLQPRVVGDRVVSNGLFFDKTLVTVDARTGRLLDSTILERAFPQERLQNRTGQRLTGVTKLVASPDGRRLVLAYQFANRLDFVDSAGRRYAQGSGPRRVTARFHVEGDRFFWDEGTEMAYVGAAATQDWVFALFCGRCAVDSSYPSLIHVFTWGGVFVGELTVTPGVLEIAVSPSGRSLLAFAEMAAGPQVAEYALPRAYWSRTTVR